MNILSIFRLVLLANYIGGLYRSVYGAVILTFMGRSFFHDQVPESNFVLYAFCCLFLFMVNAVVIYFGQKESNGILSSAATLAKAMSDPNSVDQKKLAKAISMIEELGEDEDEKQVLNEEAELERVRSIMRERFKLAVTIAQRHQLFRSDQSSVDLATLNIDYDWERGLVECLLEIVPERALYLCSEGTIEMHLLRAWQVGGSDRVLKDVQYQYRPVPEQSELSFVCGGQPTIWKMKQFSEEPSYNLRLQIIHFIEQQTGEVFLEDDDEDRLSSAFLAPVSVEQEIGILSKQMKLAA